MEPLIRPMREEDLPACAAIEATALDAWSESQLADELNNQLSGGAGRLFVAELDGKPRALAAFQLAAGEASLYAITVDPALRHQGIGRALLSGSLDALRAEGTESCYLEVRAENLPAQKLYTGLGFQMAGRRKSFYKDPPDDALVMNVLFD